MLIASLTGGVAIAESFPVSEPLCKIEPPCCKPDPMCEYHPCEYNRFKSNPCDHCEECPMDYTFQRPFNCLWTDWTAFIGVDYTWNHVKKYRAWERVLPNSAPGWNMYVGGRVEYVGAELGYDVSIKRSRDLFLVAGEDFLGVQINRLTEGRVRHSLSLFGWYFDLKLYWPFWEDRLECCGFHSIDLVGTLGYAVTKPRIHVTSTSILFRNEPPITLKARKKTALRAGIGFDAMLTDILGFRAMLRWSTLTNLRVQNNEDTRFFSHTIIHEKALKYKYAVSVGGFINF